MMIINDLIAEIERLDAEATPSPWKSSREDMDSYVHSSDGELVHVAYVYRDPCERIPVFGPNKVREDSRLIARARTLLPLCGRLLKVFARHTPDCKCYAKDDVAEIAEILEAKND